MRKNSCFWGTAIFAGTLFLAACSAPKAFYAPTVPAATTEACAFVKINRILSPQYLGQRQIVYRSSEGTLHSSSQNCWAEPLARTLDRQLPERVSLIVKNRPLKTFKSVDVSISRLDGVLDDSVVLAAGIKLNGLKNDAGDSQAPDFYFVGKTVPVKTGVGNDKFADYSAAVSEAMEALAQAVANIVVK
ncbi:MAG: PqiC family protein [Opitutales bacterium]|nr:PqiC family protein [Opitutales bacterium]